MKESKSVLQRYRGIIRSSNHRQRMEVYGVVRRNENALKWCAGGLHELLVHSAMTLVEISLLSIVDGSGEAISVVSCLTVRWLYVEHHQASHRLASAC